MIEPHLSRRDCLATAGGGFGGIALASLLAREGFALAGHVGLPTFHRGAASHIHFVVNGRPVRDRLLLGAVRGAYADTMTTLFAGGKPPEIVHLASFEFQKFADEGWLEDLAPHVRASGLDLKGWAGQDACMWKGKPVCIMMLYFGNIFAYNEEMLRNSEGRFRSLWEKSVDGMRLIDKEGLKMDVN